MCKLPERLSIETEERCAELQIKIHYGQRRVIDSLFPGLKQ